MRIRADVSGKVQGVCYRASTVETAVSLGVSGWVQNQVNGGVLFEAQGKANAIMSLLAWAEQGPSAAMVEQVKWEEIPHESNEQGFCIR